MPIFHKFLFQIKEDKPFTKQLINFVLKPWNETKISENFKINLNKTKIND